MDEIIENVETTTISMEKAEKKVKNFLEDDNKKNNGKYFPSELAEKLSFSQELALETVFPELLEKHIISFNSEQRVILYPNGGNGRAKGIATIQSDGNM